MSLVTAPHRPSPYDPVFVCRGCFEPCIIIRSPTKHPPETCPIGPGFTPQWDEWNRDTASATDLLRLVDCLQGVSSRLVAEVRRDVAAAETAGRPLRTDEERRAGTHPCDGCDWWHELFCECPPALPCPRAGRDD